MTHKIETKFNEIGDEKSTVSNLLARIKNFIAPGAAKAHKERRDYWSNLIEAIDSNVILCSGMKIIAYNKNFADFSEISENNTLLLNKFLSDASLIHIILSDEDIKIETDFITAHGTIIFVEIKAKTVEFNGKIKRMLAFKDFRQNKTDKELFEFLSTHDKITRLPNRDAMIVHLKTILEQNAKSIFTLIKINMEIVQNHDIRNQEYIHNSWLKAVAAELLSEVPTDAYVVHIGGNEFGVVCQNLPDAAQARLIGQQLRRRMSKPIHVDSHIIDSKATIGLATYPEDTQNIETLLKYAILALNTAKSQGGGQCVNYTPSINLAFERRAALTKDLPDAIKNRDIITYFQPLIHSHDLSVTAFEALVRWQHPQLGLIPPFEFLEIAEQSNLMVLLTDVVLNDALEAVHQWPEEVRVCVNISPPQLNDHLIDQVKFALDYHNVPPSRLEIEVTEDVIIHDFAHAASIFSRLRALGVQIAMDDFGAGFTSLGNMRYLNFDRIKIDRIFTMDLPHHRRVAAVVRALFVLARELSIHLTVEGVETQEQADFLKNEGVCDIQGFLYSKPKPLEEFKDFSHFEYNKKNTARKLKNIQMNNQPDARDIKIKMFVRK